MQQLRLKTLINQLNDYRDSYYNDNASVVSDKEYDALYDELESLEKELNIIYSNSPTQQVGYEVKSKLQKVTHPSKMLSLDKTKDIEQLKSFLGRQQGVLSWKLDGLTVVLTYEDGVLKQAVTRGSGEIGEDITHNARVFSNIPLTIPFKRRLVLRGEAVISYPNFEEINSKLQLEEQYKNPRNLCSGTVRQLDSKICADRNVEWFCFGIIDGLDTDFVVSDFVKLLEMGFEVVDHSVVNYAGIEEFILYYTYNKECDYPKDGLVLTYDNKRHGESLGYTSHHPLHSLAFKWKDETQSTVLREVQWQVGRTGVITPVAIFDPVELEGTTVERASLHNLSIIKGLELGIGDEVTIYKANMIIPQIEDNLTRSDTLKIPIVCPVCGGYTYINNSGTSTSLICTNPQCSAKLLGKFTHFVSRDAMNIDGLSEATLEKLIELEYLKTFKDLYFLSELKLQLEKLEGFGKRSVEKLLTSIENSRSVKMENFLYALGINLIGRTASKTISKYFKGDWYKFSDALDSNFSFTTLDDFGIGTNDSLYKWYDDKMHDCELTEGRVLDEINFILEEVVQSEQPIKGLIFVITGSLKQFTNRDELVARIESLGGKTSGSVSKNTSYLINNDTTSTSGKNKKAMELGVKIINEGQFLVMI